MLKIHSSGYHMRNPNLTELNRNFEVVFQSLGFMSLLLQKELMLVYVCVSLIKVLSFLGSKKSGIN